MSLIFLMVWIIIIEPIHKKEIERLRLIYELLYVVYIWWAHSILKTKTIILTLFFFGKWQFLFFIVLHLISENAESCLILLLRFTSIILPVSNAGNKIAAYFIFLFRTFLLLWELFLLFEQSIMEFVTKNNLFFLWNFEKMMNCLILKFLTWNFWSSLTTLMFMSFSILYAFPAKNVVFLFWTQLMVAHFTILTHFVVQLALFLMKKSIFLLHNLFFL